MFYTYLIVFKMNLKPCLQLPVIVSEFITRFANVVFLGDASRMEIQRSSEAGYQLYLGEYER